MKNFIHKKNNIIKIIMSFILIVSIFIINYSYLSDKKDSSITEEKVIADETCTVPDDLEGIGRNRFVTDNFITDGGNKTSCGQKILFDCCDATTCYFKVNGVQRYGSRKEVYLDPEVAEKHCSETTEDKDDEKSYPEGERYVAYDYVKNGQKEVVCGEEIPKIEYCVGEGSAKVCYFQKKGNTYSIEAKYLKTDKTLAQKECYRYANKASENIHCGDIVTIKYCTGESSSSDCYVIHMDEKYNTATYKVKYSYLEEKEAEAKKACNVEVEEDDKESEEDAKKCTKEGYVYYKGGEIDGYPIPSGCYKVEGKSDCEEYGYEWENDQCSETSIIEEDDDETEEEDDTTVKITFDLMGGGMNDFVCPSGTKLNSIGTKCSGEVNKNKTVSFPSDELFVNSDDNDRYIMGWTDEKTNGKPVCTDEYIIDSSDGMFKVEGTTTLYACYQLNVNGRRWTTSESEFGCGKALEVTYCFKNDEEIKVCYYEKVGNEEKTGEINANFLMKSDNSLTCDLGEKETLSDKIDEVKTCPDIKSQIGNDLNTKKTISVCEGTKTVEELQNEIYKKVTCAKGYEIQNSSAYISPTKSKSVCNDKLCLLDFSVQCKLVINNKELPTITTQSSLAGNDGKGIIKVKANSKISTVEYYYMSEKYTPPTNVSSWIKMNSNEVQITSDPGIKYFWVKDADGRISKGVGGAVVDTNTSSTTIGTLKLIDSNGNELGTTVVSYNVQGISKYVKLANNNLAYNIFNPYNSEYKLDVKSPTISVYATLTSDDANYVPGYEPRTVNLKYGVNTIFIKIKNKEGKIRTYTILANRVDDRESDNTLNEIKLSVGKINFISNVTEYKISIPNKTKEINIEATISSDKASYVKGYEPGKILVIKDSITKLIKVKSETGSIRTYVLTFVKEGKDLIEDTSLQLASLSIPDVYFPFEEAIANYNVTVGYETETINLNATLKDKDSKIAYSMKKNGKFVQTTSKGISLEEGENLIEIKVVNKKGKQSIYRLNIIRKEIGLDISNDVSLKDLRVFDHNIDFNPSKKDYTIKIKQEKSLIISAVPASNRAEVFIRGNDELTAFSTVRVKVVAENGESETYSIDIRKEIINKVLEITVSVIGVAILVGTSIIIVSKRKRQSKKAYLEE